MSSTMTQSPDPEPEKITTHRLADVQKSDQHISQLLAIASSNHQLLIQRTSLEHKEEYDEESVKEARKTYELVQSRLRDLIDEQRRWSLGENEAELEATKLMRASEELLQQRTTNLKMLNRPSIFLNAKIAKFDVNGSLKWICWLGEGLPVESSLHGIGESPALACQAFDSAYYDLKDMEPRIAATNQKFAGAPQAAPAPDTLPGPRDTREDPDEDLDAPRVKRPKKKKS